MASLTQVLASSNAAPIEDINIAGNLNEGLKAGINLATAKEQIEEKKIQVAQQKEQLEIGKLNSFNGMIKTLNLAKPAIAKQMAPKLKERFQGMGFDPAIIDTVMADPEFGRSLFNIANSYGSEIANNPAARAQALRSFEDIGMLSDGLNNMQAMDRQAAQNKFLKEQQERQIQAQKELLSMKTDSKDKTTGLTVGEKARDVKFAKEFSEFFDTGGAAGVEANLKSLDKSLTTLEQGKTTQIEGFVPDIVGNVAFPETANVRTNVTSVLIQGLKDTFGGQLSDGERKAMVESAYVASADPKDNAKRVKALADKIKSGARAKELAGQYFEENGTLKGFKGTKSFNIGDKTINFDLEKPIENKKEIAPPDPVKAQAALERARAKAKVAKVK